eukprot:Rmarinus@m.5137
MYEEGKCSKVGNIVYGHTGSFPRLHILGKDDTKTSISDKYYVTKTGIHKVLFAVCQSNDPVTLPLHVSGAQTWYNPYGFLPAQLYGFIPFFGALSLFYLLCGVVWCAMCIRHHLTLLKLQFCIAGVILLGMIETATLYFTLEKFNDNGEPTCCPLAGELVFTSVVYVAKRTVSRILVLVVSMGWGHVKPTLGDQSGRVALLGFVYFVFAMLLDIVDKVEHFQEMNVGARLLFIVPVAFLDACFMLWIFMALSGTVRQLKERRQEAKLQLYNRFTKAMMAFVALAVLWTLYHAYVIIGNERESNQWRTMWMMEAFWHSLYAGILFVIMILWWPSKNSLRYAYTEVAGEDSDDEERMFDDGTLGEIKLRPMTSAIEVDAEVGSSAPKSEPAPVSTPAKGDGQSSKPSFKFSLDDEDPDAKMD